MRKRDEPNPVPLPALGGGAIPFHYLEFLVEGSIKAVALYGSGVRLTVPRPARFAVHKLIVAQNRDAGSAAKRQRTCDKHLFCSRSSIGRRPTNLKMRSTTRGRGRKRQRAINASLRTLRIDR
ncbi:MAG: hypothetical protein JO216_16455 [Hyphomicrobiales bacterium]|nr:hypothetical protein [Hyphomicrobiales bacterium]